MQRTIAEPDSRDAYCPVRATLSLLGQKWVARIVHELMAGDLRFNELAQAVGGCNSRTLCDRLRLLEEMGVVHREIVTTTPPWVEYSLTAKGQDLGAALSGLASWGRTYLACAPERTGLLQA